MLLHYLMHHLFSSCITCYVLGPYYGSISDHLRPSAFNKLNWIEVWW